jgi:predicted amidohydrolase
MTGSFEMKVGFVQFEPVFGQLDVNREKMALLLAAVDAELIVLPE